MIIHSVPFFVSLIFAVAIPTIQCRGLEAPGVTEGDIKAWYILRIKHEVYTSDEPAFSQKSCQAYLEIIEAVNELKEDLDWLNEKISKFNENPKLKVVLLRQLSDLKQETKDKNKISEGLVEYVLSQMKLGDLGGYFQGPQGLNIRGIIRLAFFRKLDSYQSGAHF